MQVQGIHESNALKKKTKKACDDRSRFHLKPWGQGLTFREGL